VVHDNKYKKDQMVICVMNRYFPLSNIYFILFFFSFNYVIPMNQ